MPILLPSISQKGMPQDSDPEIQQIHHPDVGLDVHDVLHEEHRERIAEGFPGYHDEQHQHHALEGSVVLEHPQAGFPLGTLD